MKINIQKYFQGKKVLITGHTGFKGQVVSFMDVFEWC